MRTVWFGFTSDFAAPSIVLIREKVAARASLQARSIETA